MTFCRLPSGVSLGEATAEKWWQNRYRSYYPPLDYIYEPWMTAVMDTVAPYEDIEPIYWAMREAVENGYSQYGAEFHAHFSHWYDWGASIYPSFVIKDYPKSTDEALRLYQQVVASAVRSSIANGGVVNEHHGVGIRLGAFLQEIYGESYQLARSIKKALDPKNVLNPGKLGLGE